MNILDVRLTAKGVVLLPDDRCLLVEGRSGILSLLGGGYEDGDQYGPFDVFFREAYEEVGLQARDFVGPVISLGIVEGQVTSATGIVFIASWAVALAVSRVGIDGIRLPKDSEIVAAPALTPQQILSRPDVSVLARVAIQRWA